MELGIFEALLFMILIWRGAVSPTVAPRRSLVGTGGQLGGSVACCWRWSTLGQ